MLHDFIHAHREDLIARCRRKAGDRASPPAPRETNHGVPLFLEQLVHALRAQALRSNRHLSVVGLWPVTAATIENTRTAALHGKELLEQGYSVEQVVHGYGDVCQSITELAAERNEPVTVEEFHSLNHLLDNAIADAVSSYGFHRDHVLAETGAQELHERLGALAERQRIVIERARHAFAALRVGIVGPAGATGKVLADSLAELRDLVDRSLPEIRLASGMTQSALDLRHPSSKA